MDLIDDSVDLSEYLRGPEDWSGKVRPASTWKAEVRSRFATRHAKKYPAPLWEKFAGRMEFRPAEVTVWGGMNGHGKSMFTSQVALDLCTQNQRSLIVSLEMPPARTMQRMTRQAYADEDPRDDFIVNFHDWTDGKLWIFDHVGTIPPAHALALLRYFADKHRGQHVFLDSMMKIVQSEEHLDQQKEFMGQLCAVAIETGLHVHLIHHVRKPSAGQSRPGKYDLKGSGAVSDQADNVVIIWRDKEGKIQAQGDDTVPPNTLVTVEKQRNGEWEGSMGFWFDRKSMQYLERSDAIPMRYQLQGLQYAA